MSKQNQNLKRQLISDMLVDNLAVDGAGQLNSSPKGSRAGYLEAHHHGEPFIPLTYNSILIIDKHRPKFFLCREIPSSEGCRTTFMWGKEYVNVNAKLCARFEDDGRLMSVWLLWCTIPIERSCSCMVGDFVFMFYFFFLFFLYRFGLTSRWFNFASVILAFHYSVSGVLHGEYFSFSFALFRLVRFWFLMPYIIPSHFWSFRVIIKFTLLTKYS